MLFKIEPKETNPKTLIPDDILKNYFDKFKKFLRFENSRYNASMILEKIKDSWLIHDEIFLYNKEKRHDEALKKLIEAGEYAWAEKYCAEGSDVLLTKLFGIYVDLYNSVTSKPEKK